MNLALTIWCNVKGAVLRRFLNREAGSRNRVLAVEIEGGLEIGKGVCFGEWEWEWSREL